MRWEDLERELDSIPGVRANFEHIYPFHGVAIEIAALRADLEMTQTEFGQLVGVPQSTVARLESGQQNPSVGMLKRIAKATGTELVIEFRRPRRQRQASTRRAGAAHKPSSGVGDVTPVERVAASPRRR